MADGTPAVARPLGGFASDQDGHLARASEGAYLLLLAVAPWPFGGAQDSWRYAFAAALLFAAALWQIDGARSGRRVSPFMFAAGGALALGGLQLALGSSVAPVWTAEAAVLWCAMLSALAVLSEWTRRRKVATRLAGVLLAVAGGQAVFGVVQAAVSPGRIYGIVPSASVSPFGSYVNHNHFAGLVEMAVPLALGWALGLWRRAGGPTPGVLALGGLGLGMSAAHLASRSRGGLVALVAALACLGFLWWARHRATRGLTRLQTAAVALVAFVSVPAFGWLAVPGETRRHLATVRRGTAESAGAYRVDLAVATLRLAATRPWLGCGLGAYADAVTTFKIGHGSERATHAENDALQFASEAGLVGLLCLGALGLAIARRGHLAYRERGDPVRSGLTLGAASGAAGLLVHSCLDFNLHLPANALVFVVLLALLGPAPTRTTAPATPFSRRGASVALAGLLAIVGLGASWRAWGALSFERASRPGVSRDHLSALGDVVRWHPYLADPFQQRARVRMALAAAGSQGPSQLARARADLASALRLRPQWGEAWADRAWVDWAGGDLRAARRAMGRALSLDPGNPTVRTLDARLRVAETLVPARP